MRHIVHIIIIFQRINQLEHSLRHLPIHRNRVMRKISNFGLTPTGILAATMVLANLVK